MSWTRLEYAKSAIGPGLYEAVGTNSTAHMIGGVPPSGAAADRVFRGPRVLRRAVDLVGATLELISCCPSLRHRMAIKLDSRGPVSFRQRRRSASRGDAFAEAGIEKVDSPRSDGTL